MQVVNESHIYTDPVSEAFCPKCGEALGVEGLAAFTNVECPKCSRQFQVPARFGPFLLLELLGAGGMGGVYLARDEGLNREVAIKVMLQSLGDDINFVETFQREAQAAAKLNNPHIAQIYSFGQQYGQPYIVMELVSHGSLEEMMIATSGVAPAQAIHVGAQIAEGLREAAEAGLVHGDVKPENILFDEEGSAKLVDFGLVALSSGNANEVWGTPFYIAPEKVRRQKSDYRSDIYSLGATLYHAIANKPPFDGPDATAVVKARFEGPPKLLSEVTGKDIPPEVEALIQRMLEVDPAKRYPTYGSLLGDMKRYLSKAGPINMKTSSRRIKIKGKDAVKFERHGKKNNVTGKISSTDNDEAVLEQEQSVQAQGCKKMVVVGGLIFLGLIVLSGIIGTTLYVKAKNAVKQEYAAKLARQEKYVAFGKKGVEVAKKNAEKVKDKAPEALKYAEDAAKLAITVLGEDVRSRMVPPEPEFKMPEIQQPDASATGTNKLGSATNAVAEAVAEPEPDASATGTNKLGSATNAVAEAVAEPEPGAVESTGEQLRDDDHPFVKTVHNMYLDAYAVKRAGFVADHIVAELEASCKELEKLKQIPGTDKKMGGIYTAMKDKISGMAYIPEIKAVPYLLSNLKNTYNTVNSDLESLIVQKRLEKAEKERLERKAAEDAKKKAAQEALIEKVQNEKARISVAEGECVENIQNLRFSSAILQLKEISDEIETDQGQLALMIAKNRIKRIEEFHAYLVKNAPGYKGTKGWIITAADEKTLSIGKTKMFWKDFYRDRFLEAGELIAMKVETKAVKDSMRIREYARLLTNAALFLNAFYPTEPKAQKYARKLANEAVKEFNVDAEIIKGLLPQYFEDKQ